MENNEFNLLNTEELTELLVQVNKLVAMLDPETIGLILGLGYFLITVVFIKSIIKFFSDRADKKILRENRDTMLKVADAIKHITSEIQGCGFRGGNS